MEAKKFGYYELLCGPPIRQMVYDPVARLIVVYCEHGNDRILMALSEQGDLLADYACHVKGFRLSQRNCFVLHGPMIALINLESPADPSVLVTRFEGKAARLLACAGDASFIASCATGPILLTPQDEKVPQKWFEAHADVVTAMVAGGLHDPAYLYTGARDGRIRKWNSQSVETPIVDISPHSSMVTEMFLAINDKVLVSISTDNTIRLFSADQCENLVAIRQNRAATFVREHQKILYTFYDTGHILGWLVFQEFSEEFKVMHREFSGHHGAVTDCVFLENAMITSSLDSTLRVWNVSSAECVAVLRAHQSPVTSCFVNAENQIFSSGDDGTLYRWDMARLLSSLPTEDPTLEPSLIVRVLGQLRVVSSLIASMVAWLDPFLQAASEGEGNQGEETPDSPEICEGALESESQVAAELRNALRSCVSDSDLWQIYNGRSALHSLHLVFASVIVSLESSSDDYSVLGPLMRKLFEELLFTLEQNFATNLKLFTSIAVLFHSPKVKSVWERRTGTPIPHNLLRDIITVLPDFLRSLFHPIGVLIEDCAGRDKASFCEILAMVVRSWSFMCRTFVSIPSDLKECLWIDVNLCQCELLPSQAIRFLGSLDSKFQTSVFSECVALVDSSVSCGCLLEQVSSLQEPLIADLHEYATVDEINAHASAEAVQFMERIASFAGDCSFHLIGAVVGPLFSQCASLSEAALCALPGMLFAESVSKKRSGAAGFLPEIKVVTRVHIGHEYENLSFGSIFYSVQSFGGGLLKSLVAPVATSRLSTSNPALREGRMMRRASLLVKRTFGAFDKRKSIQIDESPRTSARESGAVMSADDYAANLLGAETYESPKPARKSKRNSSRRTGPSFAWSELLGLVDDDGPDARHGKGNSSFISVTDENEGDFKPWDEVDMTSTGSIVANVDEVNLIEDQEVSPEIATYLGLGNARDSWREVILEAESDEQDLQANFRTLPTRVTSMHSASKSMEPIPKLAGSGSIPRIPKKPSSLGRTSGLKSGPTKSPRLSGRRNGGADNATLATASPVAPRKPPPRALPPSGTSRPASPASVSSKPSLTPSKRISSVKQRALPSPKLGRDSSSANPRPLPPSGSPSSLAQPPQKPPPRPK